MLGRTANRLFWMFRYLERAENTARMLDAGLRMAVTRDLETAEAEWRSVIAAIGLTTAYESEHDDYIGGKCLEFRAAWQAQSGKRAGHDRGRAHQCPRRPQRDFR